MRCILAFWAALAACSLAPAPPDAPVARDAPSGDSAPGDAPPADAGVDARAPLPAAVETITHTFTVPAGTSRRECNILELEATRFAPRQLVVLSGSVGGGARGVFVLRTDARPTGGWAPASCLGSVARPMSPLFIARGSATDVRLPDTTAFVLGPTDRIFVIVQLENAGAADIDVPITIELSFLAEEEPARLPVTVTLGSAEPILVPPGGTSTATAFTLGPAGARPFLVTSYTHSHATRIAVRRAADAADLGGPILQDVMPPPVPPYAVVTDETPFSGSDGVSIACDYRNDGSQPIYAGAGPDEEECYVLTYTY